MDESDEPDPACFFFFFSSGGERARRERLMEKAARMRAHAATDPPLFPGPIGGQAPHQPARA